MPPGSALLVPYADENTPAGGVRRTQPVLVTLPGILERRIYDNKPGRTPQAGAVLDVATGSLVGKSQPRHRGGELLDFREAIDGGFPGEPCTHMR